MRIIPYSLLTFCVFLALTGHAQGVPDSSAINESRTFIETLKEQYPALSISVAIHGKIVWSEATGVTNRSKPQAVESSDLFRLYSLSKSITGLLVAILEDEGSIDLNKEIGEYDKSLPAHLQKIKVYQLLSHTSGVRHYKDGEWLKISSQHCQSLSEAIQHFQKDKLISEPGEKYAYSSFGYVLLSHVIEAATKRTFQDLVEEKVFKPSGSKLFLDKNSDKDSRLTFYERKGKNLKEAQPVDNSCKFGAGGFNGTAEDYTRIFSLVSSGDKIVKISTWKRMLGKFALSNGTPVNYSYGLQRLQSSEGWDLAVHTGSGLGGSSVLCIAPDYGVVITLLGNVDDDEFYKHGIKVAKIFIREQIKRAN